MFPVGIFFAPLKAAPPAIKPRAGVMIAYNFFRLHNLDYLTAGSGAIFVLYTQIVTGSSVEIIKV